MGLLDTITDLQTHVLTVQRTAEGTMVKGRYVSGATSTFTAVAVVQPAFNLNRVIGGSDLHAPVDNQSVTEVRQLHTATPLKTRTPTCDPDVIIGLDGANWTVARVEQWTIDGETHYHVVLSRQTGGAS